MQEALRVEGDKLRSKFNASVQFTVDGQSCRLDATKQTNTTKKKPDLRITTSLSTLNDLLQNKTSPQQAFTSGQLKIKGKLGLAMKLTLVLKATKRQLKKQRQSRL